MLDFNEYMFPENGETESTGNCDCKHVHDHCLPHQPHHPFVNPPPRPRFTLQEEMQHTVRRVNETVATVLKMKRDLDEFTKTIGADNVEFKNVCVNTYNKFAESMILEMTQFQTDISNAYAGLSDAYIQNQNEFRDAIESRLEKHNEACTKAYNDYVESMNKLFSETDEKYTTWYENFTARVNKDFSNFTANVENRLDGQDSVINDAVLYMKSNLTASISAMIAEMENTGEVDEIVRNIITSNMAKRIEVQNDTTSTKGTIDLANFAGQGTEENIYGVVVHNYTDSPAVRVDNVGEGAILQVVNARNPQRRADKDETFHGSGSPFYYIVQNDIDGDGATNNSPIFYITEDGHFYWTGWDCDTAGHAGQAKPVKLVTNKKDGGTYGFVLECAQSVKNAFNLMSGGFSLLQVQKVDEKGNAHLVIPAGGVIRSGDFLNLIANDKMVIQVNNANGDAIQEALKFKIGNDTLYPQMIKKCTSTARPTATIAGELWFEEDTGRTIRRNKNNNGWVDMLGNPIVPCPMYFDFQTTVDSSVGGSAVYALNVNGETVHTTPYSGSASYQHDFEDVWSATLTMYDFSGGSDEALPLVNGQRVFSTDDYVMHPGATIDLLSAFKRGGAIHITNKVGS